MSKSKPRKRRKARKATSENSEVGELVKQLAIAVAKLDAILTMCVPTVPERNEDAPASKANGRMSKRRHTNGFMKRRGTLFE